MRRVIQIVALKAEDPKTASGEPSNTEEDLVPQKPPQAEPGSSSNELSSSVGPTCPRNNHLITEPKHGGQGNGGQTSESFPSVLKKIQDDPPAAGELGSKAASSFRLRIAHTTGQAGASSLKDSSGPSTLQSNESFVLSNTETSAESATELSGNVSEPDRMRSGASAVGTFEPGKQGHDGPLEMSFNNISYLLHSSPPHSPITVWGKLQSRETSQNTIWKRDQHFGNVEYIQSIEIEVNGVQVHNVTSGTQNLSEDVQYPPEQRHLQIRTSSDLRWTLRRRSRAMALIRQTLFKAGFDEIETPLLFRSSREGAREYIVPTRKRGMAYALPQSPQQYKQMLMASGIAKYFQFAKCFRDEDLRTDRQPEFTQVDMEMSFATRRQVLSTMETLICRIWHDMKNPITRKNYDFYASNMSGRKARPFDELQYEQAMRSFGSDKPDRRIGSVIMQPPYISQDLIRKITTVSDPVVDMMKFEVSKNPSVARDFVTKFLDSDAGSPFRPNSTGAPGVFIYDESKPLEGLSAFGFEAAEKVKASLKCESGDVIVIAARSQKEGLSGSSTVMGDMRLALFRNAVEQGLRSAIDTDDFLYVTHFPMFEADSLSESGQGSRVGIRARHHPFTAPAHNRSVFTTLIHDPMKVKGNSWDLVINGVEVGGGSVRIHQADMQELIFRDVLKMPPKHIEAFRPLLNALAAACPPHAGMALGFDRLMALLLGRSSIRDVIAFPKYGIDGNDRMTGSPAPITEDQLETYGLEIRKNLST